MYSWDGFEVTPGIRQTALKQDSSLLRIWEGVHLGRIRYYSRYKGNSFETGFKFTPNIGGFEITPGIRNIEFK